MILKVPVRVKWLHPLLPVVSLPFFLTILTGCATVDREQWEEEYKQCYQIQRAIDRGQDESMPAYCYRFEE